MLPHPMHVTKVQVSLFLRYFPLSFCVSSCYNPFEIQFKRLPYSQWKA